MVNRSRLSAVDLWELNTLLSSTGHQLITEKSDPVRYEKCIRRWSLAAVKRAAAVLVPESIEAISIAVRYVTEHAIDLAVRGGGHATSGSSSTNGGLLIDLGTSTRFVQVEVNTSNRHLIAGGGANWGQVDAAGFAEGLVTVGGTVHDTGIGGLTLGGGYGWLSGKLGLTIDNLVSVKVVTADGTVLTASKEENQELFWALRGAGHNFGVAVEFVYQGHAYGIGSKDGCIGGADGGQAYAGTLVFPITLLAEVLHVLNTLFGANGSLRGGKAAGGFALMRSPPPEGPVVMLVPIVWLDDKRSGDVAFKQLFDIGPTLTDLKMMDYPGVNKIFQFEQGTRSSMKGCVFNLPIREEFARKLLESFSNFTEQVPDAARSVVQFDLMDMTKIATIASNSDMAFRNRGYHLNGAAEVFWHSAENDMVCRQWARDVAAIFKAELEDCGVGADSPDADAVMMYGNLEQYDEDARDAFGANLARIRRIKARYDPTNTFDKHFGISQAE